MDFCKLLRAICAGVVVIRFSYSQFVVPTWQVLLSVSRDLSATDQFKQDFGVLLRIAKVL